MGIMTCSKNGCGAILCTIYSTEYGYLCNSCYSALLDAAPFDIERWITTQKEDEILRNAYQERIKKAFGQKKEED